MYIVYWLYKSRFSMAYCYASHW